MDTVNDFLRKLPVEELEKIKEILINKLIAKRFFDKFRYNNSHHPVGVDGTGLASFADEPFEGCPHKTSKNGVKTSSTYVLEAKLLCMNGLSLSIGTEWYINSQDIDEKQDCEHKAFLRLAKKLKQRFPRLPILLLADSLYPNNTILDACKSYRWSYIFTFKDGKLKSVWKKIGKAKLCKIDRPITKHLEKGWLYESARYLNNIQYKAHKVNWLEHKKYYPGNDKHEERFVHLSSMPITEDNAWDISRHGRLRWKIENEGFNTQKNHGYGLQHKFARKHLGAMQNYYQLLQIAHMMTVKQGIKQTKTSLIALWEDMMSTITKENLEQDEIPLVFDLNRQLRY